MPDSRSWDSDAFMFCVMYVIRLVPRGYEVNRRHAVSTLLVALFAFCGEALVRPQ